MKRRTAGILIGIGFGLIYAIPVYLLGGAGHGIFEPLVVLMGPVALAGFVLRMVMLQLLQDEALFNLITAPIFLVSPLALYGVYGYWLAGSDALPAKVAARRVSLIHYGSVVLMFFITAVMGGYRGNYEVLGYPLMKAALAVFVILFLLWNVVLASISKHVFHSE